MSPGIQIESAEATMAPKPKQNDTHGTANTAATTAYDPKNEIFIHMPETSWINQRDPPEFDDALLASLEQKRQELDAKVHRYIAKKQGQFNDWVSERRLRYEHRTEERRHKHTQNHHHHQSHEQHSQQQDGETTEEPGGDNVSPPKTPEEEENVRQREEEARRRAENVSEEVAQHAESTPEPSPDDPAHALGSVRDRDSELLQLLPGFLPLLDEKDERPSPTRSKSAPPAGTDEIASPAPKNNPPEISRSVTAPSPLMTTRSAKRPLPRRSSLKQTGSNGGSRKAVRLSLGPKIVTPTQSPPEHDDVYDPARAAEEHRLLEEQARAIIEQGTDDKWRNEPEKTYIDVVSTDPMLADVPSPRLTPPASPNPPAKDASETSGSTPSIGSAISNSEGSTERTPHSSEASSSPVVGPTDKKKKKKKKVKSGKATDSPLILPFMPTPHRATTTTALSSGGPTDTEFNNNNSTYSPSSPLPSSGAYPYEQPEPVYQPVESSTSTTHDPNSYAGSLLSSSSSMMADSGPFYGTRKRPPPSSLRPDMASLSAVNVPLPVGGFSAGSPAASYAGGGTVPRASLGESYMALHFARRMVEREREREQGHGRHGHAQDHGIGHALGHGLGHGHGHGHGHAAKQRVSFGDERALSEVGEAEDEDGEGSVGGGRSGAEFAEDEDEDEEDEEVGSSKGRGAGGKQTVRQGRRSEEEEDEEDEEFMGDLDL